MLNTFPSTSLSFAATGCDTHLGPFLMPCINVNTRETDKKVAKTINFVLKGKPYLNNPEQFNKGLHPAKVLLQNYYLK